MKIKSIIVGMAVFAFIGSMSACNSNKKDVVITENVSADDAINESDSVKSDKVPFEGCEIDSEWADDTEVLTIFKKDSRLFIALFDKKARTYTTLEVEECNSDGMAGYCCKNEKYIEFLVEDGAIMKYVKGELKSTYEWVR